MPPSPPSQSTSVSQWPASESFELFVPAAHYVRSPDELKGLSDVIGTITSEGPLAHNYTKGCAWKSYGVQRRGDEDNGLFWLTWDECGTKKPLRDLSRLVVGKTYRFVLGPASRVDKDELQMLDAIAVGGPPCTKTPRSLELQGLGVEQTQARFGPPDRRDVYDASDRTGGIYRTLERALERAYSSDVPNARHARIEELTWRIDDCVLTVWFHHPQGAWEVLDNLYRHKDENF